MHKIHSLHKPLKNSLRIAVGLLLLAGTATHAAPMRYTIQPIGLNGPDYFGTFFLALNEQGQVTGISHRWSETGTFLGRDAWLFNGSSTVQLGYTGAGYVRSDGYRYSSVSQLNDQGQVAGLSTRYSGATDLGQDTWLYTGGSAAQVGYTGTGYERSDGYRYSIATGLNNQGQVAGQSERFSGTTAVGRDAWLYTGGSTAQLGYTGTGYERNDGYRYSVATGLNNQGQAAGYSERYSGTTALGKDAWLYTGGSTVQLGFTGTGYVRNDGFRNSEARMLNDQGQVAGVSGFYAGTNLRTDAWLYSGGNTVRIGLTDAYYAQSGATFSEPLMLNEQGQVAGRTTHNHLQDVWIYNGSTTVQIGLTGAGYELNGARASAAVELNEQGQVAGFSERNNGALGRDAWLYTGSETVLIGLTGTGYERSDGYRLNYASLINEHGQVTGSSNRYNGMTELGYNAWLYDADLDQTFSLTLSVRSDGYAASTVSYLGDDGIALGRYTLYDQNTDASLGSRAFYFSVDDGLYDLGLLVDDLTEEGWLSLAGEISANGIGNIIGTGNLSGVSPTAFLLTPLAAEVPVPAAVWLFASGLGFLGWMRRRVSAAA